MHTMQQDNLDIKEGATEMSKEALKLALEALEPVSVFGRVGSRDVDTAKAQEAITAIKQSLEQPVQPVPAAIKTVVKAMQADPDYAWGWHCNIAMAFVDAGGDHYTGNQGAARFMKMLADVEPAHELPSPPPPAAQPATEESSAVQSAPVQEPEYVYTCNGCDTLYREDDVSCDCTVNGLMEFTRHILAPDTTPPAQEFVCSTGLCHYKPAAQPAQKRHVSYVCPQCHWSLEKHPAPVQKCAVINNRQDFEFSFANDYPRTDIEWDKENEVYKNMMTRYAWYGWQSCLRSLKPLCNIAEDGVSEAVAASLVHGPWVGLTDDELRELCDEFWLYPRKLLQAIEAKLKEKNT